METQPPPASPDIPKIEWAVAAFGLLIVGALLAFLLHEAISGDRTPPRIRVEIASVEPAGDLFRAQFRAFNEGGETAAAVVIEGTLERAGAEPETSEVTMTYLPSHSERGGGLFFETDPRTGTLSLRTKSYEEP